MSWFTWGGTEKAVDNILDKDKGLLTQVGNWIGGMNYTEEEQAEANTDLRKGVVAYAVASMSENGERSKARRAIAVLWIKCQLGLVLMCAISAPWNMELAEFYFKLATSTLMITVTTAICIFFFGSHGLARHNESKK